MPGGCWRRSPIRSTTVMVETQSTLAAVRRACVTPKQSRRKSNTSQRRALNVPRAAVGSGRSCPFVRVNNRCGGISQADRAGSIPVIRSPHRSLSVSARRPSACRPLRPARPACWWIGDLAAIEFPGIRNLKLHPPLINVGLGHRKRLVRCRLLAPCDAGQLDVLLHGQIDHLACRSARLGQPAQRRPLVAGPEPVVGARR